MVKNESKNRGTIDYQDTDIRSSAYQNRADVNLQNAGVEGVNLGAPFMKGRAAFKVFLNIAEQTFESKGDIEKINVVETASNVFPDVLYIPKAVINNSIHISPTGNMKSIIEDSTMQKEFIPNLSKDLLLEKIPKQ
jgi:hypothetical protein